MDTSIPVADKETQCHHVWSEEQTNVLREHKNYHKAMVCYIEKLEEEGPETDALPPKKPRTNLNSVLRKAAKSKALNGEELHNYLQQKLVTPAEGAHCPRLSEMPNPITSLRDMLRYLRVGYRLVKHQNSGCLFASLDYGEWLNFAFELHQREKLQGITTGTWKKWIEKEVGITDAYARKLREMFKLLHEYRRFRSLGLPFIEVYQRRKHIVAMLKADARLSNYWKQDQPGPPTTRHTQPAAAAASSSASGSAT